MIQRTIPSSSEMIPVIGLGTWKQFDIGSSTEERNPHLEILKKMHEEGGKLIDSSPMYGRSQEVVGDLTKESGVGEQFFYATKVWTSGEQDGINQMNDSMRKMRRSTMDLMQIHNLVDWKTHLKTLNKWKAEGKIRYIGITHYTVSSHDELERIIQTNKLDFVQFNYSISTRNAEKSLLNAARDNGVAVIINEPLEKGSLFSFVKRVLLPEWSKDYDINSWGEFFLKYIISHPAVTCVIPATSDPDHGNDNLRAGFGRLPDERGRKKMIEFIEKLQPQRT
jgi:diketogulonate reductase-like aldo/keto reductase